MRITVRHLIWCVLSGIALAGTAYAQPTTAPATTQSATDRAALERQFQETMTGAVLVGRYTSGGGGDVAPREDRYTIVSARKLPGGGDLWLLSARIQYGNRDMT